MIFDKRILNYGRENCIVLIVGTLTCQALVFKEDKIVGTVSFSTYTRIAGCYEPYESVYAYFYCDKCGSFSLETQTRLNANKQNKNIQIMAKVLIIVETPLLAVLAWILAHNWILCSVIFVVGLILFIIFGPEYVQEKFLKCKKCGNEHITNSNVLHYAANDESVLDVPKELIVIKYIHSIIPAM
jgi:predicted nucleic-acid-binding Zn-ribbon protein